MGFLILSQPIKVLDGGQSREYRAGVNKDVTPAEAEHWYVKAAGGQYVEKLEDAHRAAPGAREEATRLRQEWETAQRSAIRAGLSAEALREDLERVEKEFGVDTKKADVAFRESMKAEEERMRELQTAAEQRNQLQMESDSNSPVSPAQAELIAAGSTNVAVTHMDGPAKAALEAQAAETTTNTETGAQATTEAPKTVDVPKTTLKK